MSERILLVEEIWDRIAAEQESLELTEAQRRELDRRLDAYEASPKDGSSWKDVQTRVTEKEGRKEFVIVPYEEFLQIQEALEDFEDLREELRKEREESTGAPTRSFKEIGKELGFEQE